MNYWSPTKTDTIHRAINADISPVNTITPRQRCFGHRCKGKHRSIRQFCNAKNEPVYEFCKLCRGK